MNSKFVAATFLAILFLMPLADASTVTRYFVKDSASPGETIAVTLEVEITGGETYYIIDDSVPQGWTIINPDPETKTGHFKVVVIQGAENRPHGYLVNAPDVEGTYAFSGTYMFEGMSAEGSIGGQDTIEVRAATQPALDYHAVVVLAIIGISAAISLVLYTKKCMKKR